MFPPLKGPSPKFPLSLTPFTAHPLPPFHFPNQIWILITSPTPSQQEPIPIKKTEMSLNPNLDRNPNQTWNPDPNQNWNQNPPTIQEGVKLKLS